ncbi:MAG: fused MFS/spermidine synthase [candidate division WOR-3 bacterium]
MLVYLILFFFSGFSALVYEVIWARLLMLAFGSTAIANTVVISAFMLGLGIGGLWLGSYADKTKNPGRLFAFLEIGTGIFSSLLLIYLPQLPRLYKGITNSFHLNQSGSLFLIFLIALFSLFIPTFLMGGTFPVMNRLYIQRDDEIEKSIGLLYGFNTIGGVLGALLTGFLFIRNFGLATTQATAIFINLVIGVFILLQKVLPQQVSKKEKKDLILRESSTVGFAKFLPLIAGLTGFASLVCEILWIRALSIFLTNSTYTFSVILVIFLTGIFIGSLIFTKISTRHNLNAIFALIQILTGLYIVIGCLFMNRLPALLFAFEGLLKVPVLRMFLPAFLLSVVVVLVPTIFMGITFPLICSIYIKEIRTLGNKIGKVYFVNTIGSAIGSIVAGFFILHYLGVIRGLVIVAYINLLIGFVFTIKLSKTIFNVIIICLTIFVSVLAFQNRFILPPSLYQTPNRQDRVLYYKETRDGTLIVSEERVNGIRSCYVNNSAVIGTTYDALKVVRMLGTLPFIIHPGAKEVLVIGFGVGVTTSTIAQYSVNQIDCVEICPGLREASKYFTNFNKYVFNNPLINFVPNDGRNFLLLSNKKYDIISCDPTHPILGSGSLYTREYFLLCREHLSEDGVVCQYLPFHKLSPDEFKTLIKTFAGVFPYTSIWLGYSHGILVGTTKPQNIDFESLRSIRDEMLKDPYLLAVSLLLDGEGIRNVSSRAKFNTDNQPFLEFFTPLSLRRENWEMNINALLEHRIDINIIIDGIENLEKLKRYLIGQRYFIEGLIYQNRGDREKMVQAFQKVLETNPENEEIRLFLRSQ